MTKRTCRIADLSVRVKRTLTDVKADFVLGNEKVTIEDLISLAYGLDVKTDFDITAFSSNKNQDGFLWKFDYLSDGTLKIEFTEGVFIEIYFEYEKYEIGTVYKNLESRLKKVFEALDDFLKDREIEYIAPINLF